MNKNYDVIIVGAGPAGLFAADRLSRDGYSVLMIDKGRNIEQRICPKGMNRDVPCNCNPCNIYAGLGGAGGKSDGKLNFHPKIGGDLFQFSDNPFPEIDYVDNLFTELSGIDRYSTVDSKIDALAQRSLQNGQEFIVIKQKHIGSDGLFGVMQRFRERLEGQGVTFRFLTTVDDLIVEGDRVTGVRLSDQTILKSGYVMLAPGREGSHWFQQIATRYQLPLTYLPIDIGVRVETLDRITRPITDIQYDPKIRMLYKDALIRNFCTNPQGFVVTENYGDYFLVNGHAEKKRKSENCNFAVLYRVNLTRPKTNTTEYGLNIAKLFNHLGDNKPIVQRLGDLKMSRRSTESRIAKSYTQPTLRGATPGDLSLAMPEKIIRGILRYLEKLDTIMPGIYRGNNTLLYAPEIKFQSMRPEITEQMGSPKIKGLFFAGDGCGLTGGIVQAAVTGILAARGIIREGR